MDPLFHEARLSESLRAHEQKLEAAAQAIPADHALATSAEDLAVSLVEEYQVEPIVLDEGAMTIASVDERIDVSHDWSRVSDPRGGPIYVPGTKITLHVPFTGEADLFKLQPSTVSMNPPRGRVIGHELQLSASAATPVPPDLGEALKTELSKVKTHIDWVNAEVRAYNDRVPGLALAAATARRDKVVADHDLVASLGIPVRRADAPKTYVAPPVRRSVSAPVRTGAGTKLEPVLPDEEYDFILGIAADMATVIERSPKAFAKMGEEDIRQHFLLSLNSHYEGDATGETFNSEGKTDILIRRDGRNIFIAECKFWSGPKMLTDTIDQLLRYTTWRDTKTAILVFNRGGRLTSVLAKISPTMAGHPSLVREIARPGETEFRFVLHHPGDPDRELTLTILVFEVPA